MDRQTALYNFWSRFGFPAYDEADVPDKRVVFDHGNTKFLTYNDAAATFNEPIPLYANLWYKDWDWTAIDQKANEISAAIGRGGAIVPFDGGAIWIVRGVPFAQRMADDDNTIRRIYINIMAEFVSAD